MILAKRLGKVERLTEQERAARSTRHSNVFRDRQRHVIVSLIQDPEMSDVIEALAGGGVWRDRVLVMPDEHEMERAILKYTKAYALAAKKLGYTMDEVVPPVPGRYWLLQADHTPFNRDLHRFALVNTSNAAVALRFANADWHRHWHGESCRKEWEAACTAFAPRFEAFLIEELRRDDSACRRRHGATA